MSESVLSVQGLSKIFHVYPGPRSMLKEFLHLGSYHTDFEALKDISFDIGRGEAVGVMGRNGAGKSTLLRILAGTLAPSSGRVISKGKIAAILELGSGFRPEYTGRQNILSGGLIMGMSKKEIMERMDEIIDFSELRDFIDQPFRTYSSGMQARLTFATAISVTPDILIVDEALSVGDAAFQAKCFSRIREFLDKGGSLFLVSHSEGVITQFCSRALLMEKGRLILDDTPKEVSRVYTDMVWAQKNIEAEKREKQRLKNEEMTSDHREHHKQLDRRSAFKEKCLKVWNLKEPMRELPGCRRMGEREKAEILDIAIVDKDGKRTTTLKSGQSYTCLLRAAIYDEMNVIGGFNIFTPYGLLLMGTTNAEIFTGIPPKIMGAESLFELRMEFTCGLAAGTYFLSANISSEHKIHDGFESNVQFSVIDSPHIYTTSLVNLEPRLTIATH